MSFLSPAFLLVAALLYAASSTSMPAIAHDRHDEDGLQSVNTVRQRDMTSSLLTNTASGPAMPFATDTVSEFQQAKLGRYPPNNLEIQQQKQGQQDENSFQHQHQRQRQANAKDSKDNNNNNEESFVVTRSSSSVVQNWSLVCKQLCGASLGGKPCAAECAIENTTRTPNAHPHSRNATKNDNGNEDKYENGNGKYTHTIFERRREAICVDLCEVELGRNTCNCSVNEAMATNDLSTTNFNNVCNSFCRHAGTTLKGCSPCRANPIFDAKIGNKNEIETEIASKADGLIYSKAVAPYAATIDATTPDWDVLCASLCKTGDGGSLCNCDMSPFFK